jgi:hypothetical protein
MTVKPNDAFSRIVEASYTPREYRELRDYVDHLTGEPVSDNAAWAIIAVGILVWVGLTILGLRTAARAIW